MSSKQDSNIYFQKKLQGKSIITLHDHLKVDGVPDDIIKRLCPKFEQFETRLRNGESHNMSSALLTELEDGLTKVKKLYFPGRVW